VPPEGVWTTCRHMQSLGGLQQLNNWSVNAEIHGVMAQRNTRHSAGSLLNFGDAKSRDCIETSRLIPHILQHARISLLYLVCF
jgi:hypothetical protein